MRKTVSRKEQKLNERMPEEVMTVDIQTSFIGSQSHLCWADIVCYA